MPLDRSAERLLRMLAAAGAGGERTPEGRRRALRALAEMAETVPEGVVETLNLTIPGGSGPIPARLYTPAARPREGGDPGFFPDPPSPTSKDLDPRLRGDERENHAPAVVFFHGGGWVAGDLETHDGVCRRLALASGVKVVAVDYRLAPEHPFPAAVEDALAAVRWTAEAGDAYGIDPARIVVAGDSAGAGLAAAVAQSSDAPRIALQALICPILNLAEASASRRDFAEGHFLDAATLAADLADYAGAGADLADPRLSPGLAPSLAGAPPALIVTAEFDPFRDEGEAYAGALRAAGVPVRLTRHEGMIHYFYALTRLIPHGDLALAQLGAEIARALG
jgi:acetyl esterase/lipase